MKIRFTGSEDEFKELKIDTLDRQKFESFRKPQEGGNPKYKPGGEKYDPKKGIQLLMYVEVDSEILLQMLKPMRVSRPQRKRITPSKPKTKLFKL